MPAPNIDWQDFYNGDVQNIGVNPYSLSGATPAVTQSTGNQANPLSGLAQALAMYGGGLTVNTGQPGGSLGTTQPAITDPTLAIPGYTDPTAGLI